METLIPFGGMYLDCACRLLVSPNCERQLGDKLYKMLLVFVRSRGEVITERDLIERVWDGHGVTRNNLLQHMFQLRRILTECGGERCYIRTVRACGFRFLHPATKATWKICSRDSLSRPLIHNR